MKQIKEFTLENFPPSPPMTESYIEVTFTDDTTEIVRLNDNQDLRLMAAVYADTQTLITRKLREAMKDENV
jgi:hypothetical protein